MPSKTKFSRVLMAHTWVKFNPSVLLSSKLLFWFNIFIKTKHFVSSFIIPIELVSVKIAKIRSVTSVFKTV